MTARGRAFDEWIAEARAVPLRAELDRRGIKVLHEHNGPCPRCGGRDRFAVNFRRFDRNNGSEGIFICRESGAGGDAIALAQHLDGTSFLAAVETLTGRPPPGRRAAETPAEREERERRLARAQEEAAAKAAAALVESDQWRQRERARAHELWRKARPARGTLVEAYFEKRGLLFFPDLRLRFLADHALWDKPPPHGTIVHRGPVMVAPIIGPDGRFGGIHMTWLDLAQEKGKALVPDPQTGEMIPAKKVRGIKRQGRIELSPIAGATRLIEGEGIETVLTLRRRLFESPDPARPVTAFWSAVDLGNMAGKATCSVPHPTLKVRDKIGRMRAQMVPGPEPAELDNLPIPLPADIAEVILVQDGDSEPYRTELAMQRAAARRALERPDLLIRKAVPPAGFDFNDLVRERAA